MQDHIDKLNLMPSKIQLFAEPEATNDEWQARQGIVIWSVQPLGLVKKPNVKLHPIHSGVYIKLCISSEICFWVANRYVYWTECHLLVEASH